MTTITDTSGNVLKDGTVFLLHCEVYEDGGGKCKIVIPKGTINETEQDVEDISDETSQWLPPWTSDEDTENDVIEDDSDESDTTG
jgi:hypothetical protein